MAADSRIHFHNVLHVFSKTRESSTLPENDLYACYSAPQGPTGLTGHRLDTHTPLTPSQPREPKEGPHPISSYSTDHPSGSHPLEVVSFSSCICMMHRSADQNPTLLFPTIIDPLLLINRMAQVSFTRLPRPVLVQYMGRRLQICHNQLGAVPSFIAASLPYPGLDKTFRPFPVAT